MRNDSPIEAVKVVRDHWVYLLFCQAGLAIFEVKPGAVLRNVDVLLVRGVEVLRTFLLSEQFLDRVTGVSLGNDRRLLLETTRFNASRANITRLDLDVVLATFLSGTVRRALVSF